MELKGFTQRKSGEDFRLRSIAGELLENTVDQVPACV